MITYKERNDFTTDQLYRLFHAVGWVKPFSEKPAILDAVDCIANHTLYIDQDDKDGYC